MVRELWYSLHAPYRVQAARHWPIRPASRSMAARLGQYDAAAAVRQRGCSAGAGLGLRIGVLSDVTALWVMCWCLLPSVAPCCGLGGYWRCGEMMRVVFLVFRRPSVVAASVKWGLGWCTGHWSVGTGHINQ